jgi:hypothetical protein
MSRTIRNDDWSYGPKKRRNRKRQKKENFSRKRRLRNKQELQEEYKGSYER